jgi:hypothetical protein
MTRVPEDIGTDAGTDLEARDGAVASGDELLMHLERDQFVAVTSEPVPPAPLGRRATAGLWALRLFVIIVSLMVLYTFVDRLH